MDSTVASDRLERLRQYRQWQPKDTSLAREMKDFASRAKRVDRTLSKLLEAWEILLPQNLKTECRPLALRSGVLEVACNSPSVAYEFTRWLQEGGRQSLSGSGQNVLRVRVSASRTTPEEKTQPGAPVRGKQKKRREGSS